MGKPNNRKLVHVMVKVPGAPEARAVAALSPMAKRLAMLQEHRDAIVKTWCAAPSDVADPIVVVAKRSDTLGRLFFQGDTARPGTVAIALCSASSIFDAVANLEQVNPELCSALRSLVPGRMFVAVFAHNGATSSYVGMRPSTGQLLLCGSDEALGRDAETALHALRADLEERKRMIETNAEAIATIGVAMQDVGTPDPVVVVGDLARYGLCSEHGTQVRGMSFSHATAALLDELTDEQMRDMREAPADWLRVIAIGKLGPLAVGLTGKGRIEVMGG